MLSNYSWTEICLHMSALKNISNYNGVEGTRSVILDLAPCERLSLQHQLQNK